MTMTRHLISTRVEARRCPRCKASTLFAHADGVPAQVDVTPINAGEEVAALIDGRATYTLITGGELVHRDEHRILAGTLQGTIHRQHRCPQDQERWRRKQATAGMRAQMAVARTAGKAARHRARLRREATRSHTEEE